MVNKCYPSATAAVGDIGDGATIMFGGFGFCGIPDRLIEALARRGVKNLTGISNNCGLGGRGVDILVRNRQIRKMVATFPAQRERTPFEEQYLAGQVELELVPQGTFAERIRAGGAGVGGFYTRTGVGTPLAEGKERRVIAGEEYVLEFPLRADFALIHAYRGDPYGNLIYRGTARNFGPEMATAADVTIAEVEELVEVGELNSEAVITPGIYVDRIVAVGRAP